MFLERGCMLVRKFVLGRKAETLGDVERHLLVTRLRLQLMSEVQGIGHVYSNSLAALPTFCRLAELTIFIDLFRKSC